MGLSAGGRRVGSVLSAEEKMSHLLGDFVKKNPATPPIGKEARRRYWIKRGELAKQWGHYPVGLKEVEQPGFFGPLLGAKFKLDPETGNVSGSDSFAGLKEKLQSAFSGFGGQVALLAVGALVVVLVFLLLFKKVEKAVTA